MKLWLGSLFLVINKLIAEFQGCNGPLSEPRFHYRNSLTNVTWNEVFEKLSNKLNLYSNEGNWLYTTYLNKIKEAFNKPLV